MKLKDIFTFNLLTAAIVVAFNAQAEQADGETAADDKVEKIHVYAKGYRSTATKSELKPIESPMTIEVVDQSLLQLRQADSVNKALRYVPGITPESRVTATIFDQYTIRGFQSYRNYYDGLPLQANNSWNLYPQVDAFATESIEILKGPTSVLYGSAPPGGMVNQIAKTANGDEFTQVRSRLGSNNLTELAVDTAGSAGDVDYRVVAMGRSKDGQQETTEERRFTIAPTLVWQAGSNTSITLSAYYQDDPETNPSTSLHSVGTLYDAPYGRLDADAYAGDKNWNNFDRTVTMVGYKINHQINDDWSVLQNFRHTDAEGLQRNTYTLALAPDQVNLVRSAYFTDEAIDGFVVDTQLAGHFEIGGASHSLLIGYDFNTLDSTIDYGDTLGTNTPMLNMSAPNYDQFVADQLPTNFYTQQHKIDQDQQGIYLQDEIKWADWTMILGGRYDQFESNDNAVKTYGGNPLGETDTKIDQDQFSGRVALMYRMSNGWAPYVNYSESFEPTSGVDSVTGDAFKPTTAQQYEAGFKYVNDNNSVQVTAAWFDLRKQNVVVNTADFAQKTQNGEVTSKGIELTAKVDVTERLSLLGNYSDLDMEVSDNPLDTALVGKTPVWVADQTASLWTAYNFDSGLMLGGGVRYVGQSAVDKYNSDWVPSYTLWDFAVSYDLNFNSNFVSGAKLTLSVNNLTDKNYVGACFDANNCWLGAERSVEAGVAVNF